MALSACLLLAAQAYQGDAIDRKYPLDQQLKVLADDLKNPHYRMLVLEKMLVTDLAAEWQRVETADNAENFLQKHGGQEKVLSDPELKLAYERRLQIRNDFLELMREGYKRYKETPPFDRGVKAAASATTVNQPILPAVALRCITLSPEAEKEWPSFRGPSGQGQARQTDLPLEWNKQGTNIAWRVKVPGKGNSSPIVWGDRIFLTCSDEDGTERAVLCYRRGDGKLLWTAKAPPAPPEPGVRDKNGYATATSVTDGQRVISFLGNCGILCHDFDGNLLWRHELKIRTMHGSGSSPILYNNLVILLQDQNQNDTVFLALDKTNGKTVWEGKRARGTTWSTPVLVRVGERDEMILAGNKAIKSYDPRTGKELWTFSGPTHEVIPMIVVGKDMIYSASGRNGPTIAIRPGGTGNITDKGLVWRSLRTGPHVPTPILVGDLLFTFNDMGICTCQEAGDGRVVWQERLDDQFSASPLAAGERIYVPGESGVVYVFKASRKLEVLARNDMGEPILASLAAVDRQLVLRTQSELMLIAAKQQ
jgi:outer membrane protein assembly factor BamB